MGPQEASYSCRRGTAVANRDRSRSGTMGELHLLDIALAIFSVFLFLQVYLIPPHFTYDILKKLSNLEMSRHFFKMIIFEKDI